SSLFCGDEAPRFVGKADRVDDSLGRGDLRENGGTQTAAAIGLADSITKFAALAELEMQHFEPAASRRIPAHQEPGLAPHSKDQPARRVGRARDRDEPGLRAIFVFAHVSFPLPALPSPALRADRSSLPRTHGNARPM